MKKFFKVKLGYNEDDYISVSEDELTKAQVLFLEGTGRGLFEDGAIRGQDIMRIKNDWHKLRGWNRSWKMTDEDYADIKHLEEPYRKTYLLAESVAKEIIKQNRREVLSENKTLFELKEIFFKELPNRPDTKQLADKFKIN